MLQRAALLSIACLVGCSDDEASGGAGAGGSSQGGSSDGGSSDGGASDGGSGDGGGGGGACPTDTTALGDGFDGASLDPCWTIFNDAVVQASVANGALALELVAPALWFNTSQGALLYKTVTGDFRVTTTVRVRKASANEAPDAIIHLAGLMARDPASDDTGTENYVFIVAGFDENDISIETKSTVDDVSDYDGPSWPSADAELRICRVGAAFTLYKRPIGGATWEEAQVYDRPDMPSTLQVGPNIYSLMQPDLLARFDEVAFAPVTSVADCTAD